MISQFVRDVVDISSPALMTLQTVRHCSRAAYGHHCTTSGMTSKEQFPDLRSSEQELQESNKQLLNAERRLGHLNETIAELEAKVTQAICKWSCSVDRILSPFGGRCEIITI